MFFSNKNISKNPKSKKRNRNIYGIFGRSDSDDSVSGDEDRFKPIFKDSDSSSDNYYSDDSENFNKYKKNTNKNKYTNTKNNKNRSKSEKTSKSSEFLGFVSGGTLNLSQVDSSSSNTNKEQQFEEHKHDDYNSDMELNSDEELLNQVLDYDDYVLVEEDEQLLNEKRKQLQMEKQMREQYNSNFQNTNYLDQQYEEQLPTDNKTLKEDKMKKIYGKGLNMLKKMGYKGGGLGREGKGLVNPLSFTSSKDNSSVYKIEELDKHERKLTGSMAEQMQTTGVSEGDSWLEWLNKRYNQSLDKKEQVENKRKELNKLNLRLNEEIKLLNLEVQRKLKLLEDFEKLRPKIENKYQEFIETLNNVSKYNNTNNNKDNSINTNNTNNNTNKEEKEDIIDEVVDKLIKLLKLLSKIQHENKMKRVAIRLTFKNLFGSDFKSDVYFNLSRYENFLESLPVINSYLCYSGDNVDYKNLLTYESSTSTPGVGNTNNSNKENNTNNEEIKEMLNFYVINSLMEYYRDIWDPVDLDKGLNLYQYANSHLSKFYENTNNNPNDNDDNNNTNNTNNNNNKNNKDDKKITKLVGLNAVLNEINSKLEDYIKKLEDVKELSNCHIFIFPWLQYLHSKQVHHLADVFMGTLFNNTNQLMAAKYGILTSQDNTLDNISNPVTGIGVYSTGSNNTKSNVRLTSDNVEIYENIYNNWNKLMLDKKEFENKLYDKLYQEISSMNMSLIFNFNLNDKDNNNNTNNTNNNNTNTNSNNNTHNNKENINNEDKLNELLNITLSWNKLVDEETMVKLLFNTILLKFRQFLVQSLSSLSRNYDEYQNNNTNNNEYSKELKKQRENIVEFYVYFKSLLPNYVKNNKNIQEHCFKVVLNKMESFVNCYSNTGTENINNTNNNNNNTNKNNNTYNREYESEESSISGDEDY